MPEPTITAAESRRRAPDRVTMFTDGVLAIVITILVLELKVPELEAGQSLSDALVESRDTLVSFVISFLLVGMYWSWHRDVFANVRAADHSTVWLNLLFLLPLCLIPYASSVLGEYPDSATALHLYGTLLILVTLMRTILASHLYRHPDLMFHKLSTKGKRIGLALALAPVLVYAIAIALADTSPLASTLIYLAMPALYLLTVFLLRSDPRTRLAADDVN